MVKSTHVAGTNVKKTSSEIVFISKVYIIKKSITCICRLLSVSSNKKQDLICKYLAFRFCYVAHGIRMLNLHLLFYKLFLSLSQTTSMTCLYMY